jgi:hypothetical protein
MMPVTTTAVATATVASNLSYAQPTAPPQAPATVASRLSYAQPVDPPEMPPAMVSSLNYAQPANPPAIQADSPHAGDTVSQMHRDTETPDN